MPRITFEFKMRRVGVTVSRSQFPLQVAYAVTFNKSQGKTLRRAVIDVRVPVFAHGQLYVAMSRVRSREDLMVLASAPQVRRCMMPCSDMTWCRCVVEHVPTVLQLGCEAVAGAADRKLSAGVCRRSDRGGVYQRDQRRRAQDAAEHNAT